MRSDRVAFHSQHFVPVDGAGAVFSNICARRKQFCECFGACDTQLCHVTVACDLYTQILCDDRNSEMRGVTTATR